MKKLIILISVFPMIAQAQTWPSFFTWNKLQWGMTPAQVAATYPIIKLPKDHDSVVISHTSVIGLGADIQVFFRFKTKFMPIYKSDVSRPKQAPTAQTLGLELVDFSFTTTKPISRNINEPEIRPKAMPLNFYPAYLSLIKTYGEPTMTDQNKDVVMIPGGGGGSLHAGYNWTWEKTNIQVKFSAAMSFDFRGQNGKYVTNHVNSGGSWNLQLTKPPNQPKASPKPR